MARSSATRRGNGAGLYGAAKGAGNGRPAAPPFAPGNPGYADAGGGPNGGHGSRATFKSLSRQDRIDALMEMQWTAAHDAQSEVVRLQAQNALLDRIDGKPVQRTINHHTADPSALTDAELAAIAIGGGFASAGAEADQD